MGNNFPIERVCFDGGYVGPSGLRIASDPGVYMATVEPIVCCNRLRCRDCGQRVRHRDDVRLVGTPESSAGLYAQLNEAALPILRKQRGWRLYACRCGHHAAVVQQKLGESVEWSWECAGHPPADQRQSSAPTNGRGKHRSQIWSFDPAKVKLSGELANRFSLHLDVYEESIAELKRGGAWWVFPIASGSGGGATGLRILPGESLSRCPVVMTAGSHAFTIASRPSAFVPIVIFWNMYPDNESWRAVANLTKAAWTELGKLHRALGGTKASLDELRKIAKDKRLKTQCVEHLGEPDGYRARAEIFTRLDPSASTSTWWRYCLRAIADQNAPLSVDVGPWNAAVAALAFVVSGKRGDKDAELDAAWQMMKHPPGVDSFPSPHGFVTTPHTTKAGKNVQAAAKAVLHSKAMIRGYENDLRWPAIEALAASRKIFDGTAYLEAAKTLQGARRFEDAFTACTAASFWRSQAKGDTENASLDAALGVARAAKWRDTVDALERVREMFELRGLS